MEQHSVTLVGLELFAVLLVVVDEKRVWISEVFLV
jgi:hypothetical protein